MNKTRYFKNCLGVFQGGGCKAIAYIGAFRETENRGVSFSEVAGTSAGSLFAALIAAGATSEYMEQALSKTNFTDFLAKPDKSYRAKGSRLARLAKPLPFKKSSIPRFVIDYFSQYGLFSSNIIEDWLEGHLRTLLNFTATRKVRFDDLNIPLHVVATDVLEGGEKVWSSASTPCDAVSEAVKCSCAIPIIFQPVDRRYVDGGLVSNLPLFALSSSGQKHYQRVLCFTFSKTGYSAEPETPKEFAQRLIFSSIEGSTNIQSSLNSKLHDITIRDLPLDTADFENVTPDTISEMITIGLECTKGFFDKEALQASQSGVSREIYINKGEALNHIVLEENDDVDEVHICLANCEYAYKLFPLFLSWSIKGLNVKYTTTPNKENDPREREHESLRRYIIKTLGFSYSEEPQLPVEGIFFKYRNKGISGFVKNTSAQKKYDPFYAVRYDTFFDEHTLNLVYEQIQALHNGMGYRPKIEVLSGKQEELIKKIKSVDQYKYCDVSIEAIYPSDVSFLTRFIKSYKFSQIDRLFSILDHAGIAYFEPAFLRITGDHSSSEMLITPPVVEQHGKDYFLIEGNSRLTYLLKNNYKKQIQAVIVRGVSETLPADGEFKEKELLISDKDNIGDTRYTNFKAKSYRWIEQAIRPPGEYIK